MTTSKCDNSLKADDFHVVLFIACVLAGESVGQMLARNRSNESYLLSNIFL